MLCTALFDDDDATGDLNARAEDSAPTACTVRQLQAVADTVACQRVFVTVCEANSACLIGSNCRLDGLGTR